MSILMKDIHSAAMREIETTKPNLGALDALLESVIQRLCGTATICDALFEAEREQLLKDALALANKAARSLNQWVDTTVQGDLFIDLPPVRFPRQVVIDDQIKTVNEVSLHEAVAWLGSRIQTQGFVVEAHETVTEKQRAALSEMQHNLRTLELAQAQCIDSGGDPRAVLLHAKATAH
jgi:hypothetical protein